MFNKAIKTTDMNPNINNHTDKIRDTVGYSRW